MGHCRWREADGSALPCRHHSVRGVQLWAASRMVELTFKRFMVMCSGTWAMNYYLRALGAKIGAWSTVRLGLCLPLLPDSIELGSGCAAHPHLSPCGCPAVCSLDSLFLQALHQHLMASTFAPLAMPMSTAWSLETP